MPERTYKLIELVGVSENTMEEAIRNALARASQTLKGMDWFEVTEVTGAPPRRAGQPISGEAEGRLPHHERR
jgi:flavin-binding protein dodecin